LDPKHLIIKANIKLLTASNFELNKLFEVLLRILIALHSGLTKKSEILNFVSKTFTMVSCGDFQL
jgi:hypothetical protein